MLCGGDAARRGNGDAFSGCEIGHIHLLSAALLSSNGKRLTIIIFCEVRVGGDRTVDDLET